MSNNDNENTPLDPQSNQTNPSTILDQKIQVENWKKPCKCIKSTDDIIQFLKDSWKLENPKLILSITGGATNIALRHEVKKIFKEGLIKAAKSTGAWIISGGTDYGVMRLVGDAVNEGIKTENLVVLGIATKCKVTTSQDNEALLINNGEKKLNPYHSHFILVSEGESTEWGQEIPYRSKLEEMLIGDDGHMVLIVVGGGKGTFQTVFETLAKRYPVLVLENSGACADVLIKILKDKNIEPKELLTNPQSIYYCEKIKAIIEEKAEIKNLIKIFGMNNNEDIEHTTLKALINNKSTKQSQNTQQSSNMNIESIRLAFNWNAVDYFTIMLSASPDNQKPAEELKILFNDAIIQDKAVFVEIMLDKFKIEQFFQQNDCVTLYQKIILNEKCKNLPFVFLMGELPEISIKLKVSQILHDLMGNDFGIGEKIPTENYTNQKLFLFSIFFNRFETAFFFWKRGDNQMINALFAAQFLKKLSGQYKSDNQELLEYSKKFEDAAIGILKNLDFYTHYFINYCALFRHVDFYQTSPLELSIECDRKNFVAQAAVQSVFDDIWFGMVDKFNFLDMKFIKYIASILSIGILAPIFYSKSKILNKVEGPMDAREDTFFTSQNYEDAYFNNIVDNIYSEIKEKSLCKVYFVRYSTFMTTPIVQATYALLYFFLFLIFFSHFLISKYPSTIVDINDYDSVIAFIILNVLVFCLFVDEIHQLLVYFGQYCEPVFQKEKCSRLFKIYYKDKWNITDNIGIFLFLLGDILLFVAIGEQSLTILRWSKFIYSLDFIFWAFKALHFCTIDQHLGPKLRILVSICKNDMRFFIIVIGIISLIFGIISHSTLLDVGSTNENNTEMENLTFLNPKSLNNTEIKNATGLQAVLQSIIHNAYWPIFGEITMYDDIECTSTKCPKPYTWQHKFVFILLMFYVLAILVLVNLLIAMFNSTFEKIHKKTDIIWKFQRFYFIFSYLKYSVLPPPLSLIHRFIMCCYRYRKTFKRNGDDISYLQFERQCAYEYLNRLEKTKEVVENDSEDKY